MIDILSKFRRIAEDHDNIEDLERFNDLDTCVFGDYRRWIETEWHSYESRELNGVGRYVGIGRPWESITFPVLTWKERNVIYNLTNGLDGLVTYETYDKDAEAWKIFNGTLSIVSETLVGADYRDVTVEIRDLVDITP